MIENGSVYIEGERIVEVGRDVSMRSADHVIDATGNVVMPGIVTAHTHLYGILLRGCPLRIEPPTDFAQVLQRVWWPLDEVLTVEDAYASALAASAEMLLSGSTFFADTYSGPNSINGSLDAIARATRELGIRSMLSFEVTERHNSSEGEQGLRENIRFARSLRSDDNVSAMMSVHASFTVSDELIQRAADAASELDIPLTIHTSEGLVDLYHNLERHGERTVERLNRLGVLRPRTVLAHCVHVNDHEIELMASSGCSVAHNPMSNMLNAVGTAPVPRMLAQGVCVGLGNDGWIFDPFENMRCALTVHRLVMRDPSIIGPLDVLRMSTIDAARSYGVNDRIGSLEAGKLADVTVIDAHRAPTPVTAASVVGHIVNTFSGRDVRTVLVNGHIVVDDTRLVLRSEQYVSDIARRNTEQLWSRLLA